MKFETGDLLKEIEGLKDQLNQLEEQRNKL